MDLQHSESIVLFTLSVDVQLYNTTRHTVVVIIKFNIAGINLLIVSGLKNVILHKAGFTITGGPRTIKM